MGSVKCSVRGMCRDMFRCRIRVIRSGRDISRHIVGVGIRYKVGIGVGIGVGVVVAVGVGVGLMLSVVVGLLVGVG